MKNLTAMSRSRLYIPILGLIALLAVALSASASAAPGKPSKGGKGGTEHVQPPVETSEGSLEQLPGRLGCLAEGKASKKLCGKARALMKGRLYVTIEDVEAVAFAVLRHRIVPNFNAAAEGITVEQIILKILSLVPRGRGEKLL